METLGTATTKSFWNTKNRHGDCRVPQRYQPNQPLGVWVRKQQENFKSMQEGKKNPLNPERFELLQKIGFVWQRSARKPRKNKKSNANSDNGIANSTHTSLSCASALLFPNDSTSVQVAPKKRGKRRKINASGSNDMMDAKTNWEENIYIQDQKTRKGEEEYQVDTGKRQETQLYECAQQPPYQQEDNQQREQYEQPLVHHHNNQQPGEQQQLLQQTVDNNNYGQWFSSTVNNNQTPGSTGNMWGFANQSTDNGLVATGMAASFLQQVGAAYGSAHGISQGQDNSKPMQNNGILPNQDGEIDNHTVYKVNVPVFDSSLYE